MMWSARVMVLSCSTTTSVALLSPSLCRALMQNLVVAGVQATMVARRASAHAPQVAAQSVQPGVTRWVPPPLTVARPGRAREVAQADFSARNPGGSGSRATAVVGDCRRCRPSPLLAGAGRPPPSGGDTGDDRVRAMATDAHACKTARRRPWQSVRVPWAGGGRRCAAVQVFRTAARSKVCSRPFPLSASTEPVKHLCGCSLVSPTPVPTQPVHQPRACCRS